MKRLAMRNAAEDRDARDAARHGTERQPKMAAARTLARRREGACRGRLRGAVTGLYMGRGGARGSTVAVGQAAVTASLGR